METEMNTAHIGHGGARVLFTVGDSTI